MTDESTAGHAVVTASQQRLTQIVRTVTPLLAEARALAEYLDVVHADDPTGLDWRRLGTLIAHTSGTERSSSSAAAKSTTMPKQSEPDSAVRSGSLRARVLAAIGPTELATPKDIHRRLVERGQIEPGEDARGVANALGGLRRTGVLHQYRRGVYMRSDALAADEIFPYETGNAETAQRAGKEELHERRGGAMAP